MNLIDLNLEDAKEKLELLNQAKHFNKDQIEFWKWSDIAAIHSDILEQDRLIIVDYFHTKLKDNIVKTIPGYKYLMSNPVHVKTICNQNNKTLNSIDTGYSEHNLDQQISRLGCEFYFQKFYNTEFSQAYFLFPNASLTDLINYANEINLYRTSKKIQNVTRIFYAMVADRLKQETTPENVDNLLAEQLKQKNKTENFDYLLNVIWCELFATTDIQNLKNKYNITNSPTTHLMPEQWIYVYYMLQDIVNYVSEQHEYSTRDRIARQCAESAQIARSKFQKHTEGNKNPEDFLTQTDFKEIVRRIENARKYLWSTEYKKSL